MQHLEGEYGVADSIIPGFQVIGLVMAIYIMFKCDNIYMMVYVKDGRIPDSLSDMKVLSSDIKTWLDLQATISYGLRNVLQ
ncbi:hypothetical protein BGZ94_003185, partial [Podila epigama]